MFEEKLLSSSTKQNLKNGETYNENKCVPNNKEKPQERYPDDEIFSLPDNCIICPLQ